MPVLARALRLLRWGLGGFAARHPARPDPPPLLAADLPAVWLILSGVPIDDTGGGARATQLARELLRRGEGVVFVNRFPKYESVELGLRLAHPRLVATALERLDVRGFLAANAELLRSRPVTMLVEFALPEFLPLIDGLRALGAVVVYDLLDEWHSSLGAAWYTPRRERAVVRRAQVLVATAPTLAQRLEARAGRPVHLVPNAADLALFDPARPHPRPPDLPQAAWTVLYFGALWGDWFDWDLLLHAARRWPEASFVLIGDYRGQCPEALPNLHFTGLKPQAGLPAYLAHAQVAMVPWKLGPITTATSPIKVYEYLAMRRPVVAPELPLLRDMPFVLCSPDAPAFAANLERARRLAVGGPALDAFLAANSWAARVDALQALAARARQSAGTA